MFKKVISIVLMVSLIMSCIPTTVLAQMENTKDNTVENNQQILDAISNTTLSNTSKDDMLILLENLGLLDGEGELVTSSINVDGEEMTLEEIRDMLNVPDLDLTKTVSVNGTSITFSNFKIMLAIEDELSRIRSEYLEPDITLTEAHEMALESLYQQLLSEGLTFNMGDGTVVRDLSGVHRDVRVSLSVITTGSNAKVTASLNKEQTEDVSFNYTTLNGSFYGVEDKSGTVIIKAGETSTAFIVNFIPSTDKWYGQRGFYINCNNIKNALFSNELANETFLVPMSGNYDFLGLYQQVSGISMVDEFIKTPALYTWDVNGNVLTRKKDGVDWLSQFQPMTFTDKEVEMHNKIDNLNELGIITHISGIDAVCSNNGNISDLSLRLTGFGTDENNNSEFFTHISKFSGNTIKVDKIPLPNRKIMENLVMIGLILESESQSGRGILQEKDTLTFLNKNRSDQLCFIDGTPATVTSVEANTVKNYTIGDNIPIVVTFSEPVKPDNLQLVANGMTLTPKESKGTFSERLSFLYPVTQPISEIVVSKISGAKDLGNNTMNAYNQVKQLDVNDITLVNKRDAFLGYNLDIDGNNATIEIPIDTVNTANSSWIISEAQENDNAGMISSLSAKVVGEDHGPYDIAFEIDDVANPTKIVGQFTVPYNFTNNNVKYIIAFYLDKEIGSSENKELLYDVDTSYTIVPTVYLENGEFLIDYDTWPPDLSEDLYIDELGALDLDITVLNAKATWQSKDDFLWESSDENIATINSDGEIVFTGRNGLVYFTLTALNGNVEGEQVTINTETMSVKAGLTPFLLIPEGANVITATKGNSAELRWSSNIVQKKIDAEELTDTNFDISIYKAVYFGDDITKGELVYSDTILSTESNQVSSYSISAEVMTDLSVIGKVSYVVEVSSERITANGYIEVKSSPAVVTLEPLNNLFITDQVDCVGINYLVDNFDSVNDDSEFLFRIIKNEEETPIIESSEMTGSYNLVIDDVDADSLKDIYTVTVMAKNALEPTWSYDSYVLYVYNEDAIKIMVDGEVAAESVLLDNNARIAAMTSEEILNLKREISLDSNLSINSEEYAWAELGDMITWDSSGNSATINYNNYGTYYDINALGYTGYAPSTDFILSGLSDGDTTITAIHGLSKMSDSVDITVTTLKDKLYLFQAFPKAETELTYYNQNGDEKRVATNSEGAIAIYEENGINSDIYFKSVYSGDVYLGTVYNDNLKTKEQDITKNKIYPLNIAELRPVTKPSVVLNTKDGEAFNGNVTLRGGVYKNGQYCENALINGNDGKIDQTVLVSDGVFEVNLDSTQFWIDDNTEVLNGTDDIEFVFELQFPTGKYYPEVIKIEGNVNNDKVVQNGENNRILTSIESGGGDCPYLYESSVIFEDGSELKVNSDASKIGPNKNFPNIELVSNILCLDGEIGDSYTSLIIDQFKDEPAGQSYSMLEYPFSSFPILVHRLRLNKDTLWMGDRLSRSISIKVNKDNTQVAELPYHFNIVNLINIDITEDGGVTGFPNKMLSDIMDSNEEDFSTSDRVITAVLERVSDVEGLDTSVIQMMLKPTVDPAIFDTIIKINVGYGDVGGIDDREKTGTYVTGPTEDAGKFKLGIDGAIDTKDFFGGDYKKDFKGDGKAKRATSLSPSFEGGGYITGKIRYNFDSGEWEMFTTSSSFNIAAGINAQILINSSLGPVPVTAEFNANGSVTFVYAMASHSGTKIERLYDKEFVNDYLKELRFDLYVKAFGGVGVDYSVIALKVGVFGDQDLSLTQRWLYRGYLESDTDLFGREIRAEGRLGIEFKAKIGFIDYTKVLASAGYSAAKGYYSWDDIDDYWKEHKNGTIQDDPISVMASSTFNNRGMDMEVAYQTVALEGRDYLEKYDRVWNGTTNESIPMGEPFVFTKLSRLPSRSIDETSEVNNLETNSYPYSNPMFTDDGELLVYLSDMDSSDVENTKVCFSRRSGDSYAVGSELYHDALGYGDSYLNMSGDGSFAVATWVTQTESINKDAGTELTKEDIALMNNSTEIMASIYSDGGWSDPVALSDNKNADLAPVVSTNGDKVLVAWRSAYADDAEKPIEFGGNDKIVFKTYDKTSDTWSEDTKVLYNGTLGNIMGIETGMLDDGTSSIVYTVEKTVGAGDPNAVQNNNNLEVLFCVINNKGDIVQSVRATNDNYVDENPKITTHTFDDGIERFVIGWYSVNDTSDIRLCAFNKEGAIYNGFIDSISQVVSSSDVNISSKFKFSKGEPTDDISIIWVEPMKSNISGEASSIPANKDGLYGIKILAKDQRFYATSPNELAVMDDYTLIDHFDARTDTGNIKAIILATDYNSGVEKSYTASDGTAIYVKEGVSELLTVTGVFDNSIRIDSVYYDLESVRPGMEIPIQFEVYNSGIDVVKSVDIKFGSATQSFALEHPLLSGSSKTFTVYYTVPEKILNVDYIVTANYDSESVSENDRLYMVFPDVGISKINIVEENQGLRDIAFSLYNDSGIKLDEHRHRVLVDFYDNANLEGDVLNSVIITSAEDIEKINNGTYSSGIRFNIADLVEDGREIPSGGITIYGYAKIEEFDASEYINLPEINEANNKKSVTFESLIEKQNNQKVTILTKQRIDDGKTIVDVTVQNNSLAETTNGNLIVSILNKDGEVIEQRQSFDVSKENSGLIQLGYEERASQSFKFDSVAELSEVVYSDAILDADNADLGSLSFEGLEFYFDSEVDEYTINSDKPISSIMQFTTANPNATAKVNGIILSENKMNITVNDGDRQISIEVISADGTVIKEYIVNIGVNVYRDSKDSDKNNEKVVLNLETNKKVSMDYFKQLAEGNVGSLVLNGGFYTMEFSSGQEIKDVNATSINFELSLNSPNEEEIGELVKSDDVVNLYFTHHGQLPAKAKVKVDLGESYKGKEFYLYYYNEATNKLESYVLLKVDTNGVVEFEIDHCSDYILYDELILRDGLLVQNIDDFSYISGYSDGTFRPDANITRAEVAKLFDNILTDIEVNSNPFTDCEMWAKDSILQLSSLGFVNGYSDSSFRPNNEITRAEFAKLITNILEIEEIPLSSQSEFDDISNSWAKNEIELCNKLGLVNGYNGSFRPNDPITRAEAVTIINRLIGRKLIISTGNSNFYDVPKRHWAYLQIINATK